MPLSVLRNRRLLPSLVVSVALATVLSGAVLAVGRDKVMYVRGTLSAIKKNTEGRFNTQADTELAFNAGKKGSVAIPYAAIASLAFEEEERRVLHVGLTRGRRTVTVVPGTVPSPFLAELAAPGTPPPPRGRAPGRPGAVG